MTRYEMENAVRLVDGYCLRIKPTIAADAEFVKAKAECLHHLRVQIATIESLTFEQFAAGNRIKAGIHKGGKE